MSDENKRRPSASRRARLDTRAEPNSALLPEPESLVTRGRRGGSTPPRPKPGVEIRGPESLSDPAALRRQVSALQQELAQTQHRLAAIQEEREEETDRFSEMLARVTVLESGKREADAKLGREGAGEEGLTEADRRTAGLLADLAKLKADLEKERETTAWLRTAGEQATREVAAFRARATAPELKAVRREVEEQARADEVKRLTSEQERAKEELLAAQKAAEREASRAAESAAAEKRADEELAAARSRYDDLVAEHDRELARLNEESATRIGELEANLTTERATLDELTAAADTAKADLRKEHSKALETAAEAAKADATRALDAAKAEHASKLETAREDAARALSQLRSEHSAAVARLSGDHQTKLAEAVKGAEEKATKAAGVELARTKATVAALEKEKADLLAARTAAEGRTKAAAKELDATTAMLKALIRSHEVLESGEDQMAKLREEARSARADIADQTIALRLALSRLSDAVHAPEGDSKKK
jgi:chromosome segregation ATPase